MRANVAVLAGLISITASAAHADEVWHWVRVKPGNAGWSMCKGDAPVSFESNHFAANMVCTDNAGDQGRSQLTLRVEGEIHGETVVAKMTEMNTDASPETLSGIIRHSRYSPINQPKIQAGDDIITLNGGATFVGLNRSIWQPKP